MNKFATTILGDNPQLLHEQGVHMGFYIRIWYDMVIGGESDGLGGGVGRAAVYAFP